MQIDLLCIFSAMGAGTILLFCCRIRWCLIVLNLFNCRSPQIPKSFLKKFGDHENNEVVNDLRNHEPFMLAWRECSILIDFMQGKSFEAAVARQKKVAKKAATAVRTKIFKKSAKAAIGHQSRGTTETAAEKNSKKVIVEAAIGSKARNTAAVVQKNKTETVGRQTRSQTAAAAAIEKNKAKSVEIAKASGRGNRGKQI